MFFQWKNLRLSNLGGKKKEIIFREKVKEQLQKILVQIL